MRTAAIKFKTVDEYLSTFPADTKQILQRVRKTIKQAAPGAEELISYNMPAFKLNGILVYFAGYKNHVGLYPTASAIEAFKNDISQYTFAKGSIQFPLSEPIPYDLITRIVKFRVKENTEKAKAKK
jgi:uncharacterized protein YdhG (YjbR/CyaY superfamily)